MIQTSVGLAIDAEKFLPRNRREAALYELMERFKSENFSWGPIDVMRKMPKMAREMYGEKYLVVMELLEDNSIALRVVEPMGGNLE